MERRNKETHYEIDRRKKGIGEDIVRKRREKRRHRGAGSCMKGTCFFSVVCQQCQAP